VGPDVQAERTVARMMTTVNNDRNVLLFILIPPMYWLYGCNYTFE
jgi:hypothetical protein